MTRKAPVIFQGFSGAVGTLFTHLFSAEIVRNIPNANTVLNTEITLMREHMSFAVTFPCVFLTTDIALMWVNAHVFHPTIENLHLKLCRILMLR